MSAVNEIELNDIDFPLASVSEMLSKVAKPLILSSELPSKEAFRLKENSLKLPFYKFIFAEFTLAADISTSNFDFAPLSSTLPVA